MYLAILRTYYEIYALGATEEEVKKNIVKGYKKTYPLMEDRSVKTVTFDSLNEHFGVAIYHIGKNGFAAE